MVDNNSQTADEYFDRGNKVFENGDVDGAIADYGEAIRLKPNHVDTWYNRSEAWSEKGDLDAAIRLKPDNPPAWNNRGFVWGMKDEFEKALADYDEAIQREPNDQSAIGARDMVLSLIPHKKQYRAPQKL